MTKEEKLKAAIAAADKSDPLAAWREIDKEQVSFESFRSLLLAVRSVPAEVATAVIASQSLPAEEAFAKCQPEYLSAQEFLTSWEGRRDVVVPEMEESQEAEKETAEPAIEDMSDELTPGE